MKTPGASAFSLPKILIEFEMEITSPWEASKAAGETLLLLLLLCLPTHVLSVVVPLPYLQPVCQ